MDYCLVEQPLSIPSNIVNPGNNVINSNFPFASSTDYRIGGTNSPAYNAGNEAFTIAAGITEDLNGELRILDNRVDIGAYEYQSSSISSQKGNSGIDENEDYANVEDAKKQKSDQENHSIVVYLSLIHI